MSDVCLEVKTRVIWNDILKCFLPIVVDVKFWVRMIRLLYGLECVHFLVTPCIRVIYMRSDIEKSDII